MDFFDDLGWMPTRDKSAPGKVLTLINEFERYRGILRKIVSHIIHPDTDVDDILQSAYLRAFGALERFEGDSMKSWLTVIARNAALDESKRQIRRGYFRNTELIEETVPDHVDLERTLVAREMLGAVRMGVEQLGEIYQEVFALNLKGLTTPQAAEALGIPLDTAGTRLKRARLYLRQQLGGNPDFYDNPGREGSFSIDF
tara:strand:- start:194 stop:793 length:600 start_codon:yes stop_codon:yes gene_type:complete